MNTKSHHTHTHSKIRGVSEEEAESGKLLYSDENHKFIWLGWSHKGAGEVQANQFLIVSGKEAVLLDPGGVHVFPFVISTISRYISLESVRYIFYSHQDPDVCSGMGLFMSVCPNARFLISRLWLRFVPHFGSVNISRVEAIQDSGTTINLPFSRLHIIPAHFLHSEGNFSLYDSRSKILFSGDIGASVMPENDIYFEVEDFEKHVKYMEWFHKRYMKSNKVLRKWVSIVRKYEVEIIAPQHGAIFRGENVRKFLSWLENLKCGDDILEEIYGY